MSKINITKPTGSVEDLSLLSAFKVENNTYIIFDSEKVGSMGLPIIYVSKLNDQKLEKITDQNEWQNAKNYLKGIINGTNFEYIKPDLKLSADEVYYMPLTLPQASFDLIKNRYQVKEAASVEAPVSASEPKIVTPPIEPVKEETTLAEPVAPINPMPDLMPVKEEDVVESKEAIAVETPKVEPTPITPLMPNNDVISNEEVVTTKIAEEITPPPVEPTPVIEPQMDVKTSTTIDFTPDKEAFLSACANMFDALVAKCQKEYAPKNQTSALNDSVIPNSDVATPPDYASIMPTSPDSSKTDVI